jgi:23S rRNA G2445 N2-methylase RlmL
MLFFSILTLQLELLILRSIHVIAIDIDPQKIAYARNNAAIYGVDGLIDFVLGDSIQIAPYLKVIYYFVPLLSLFYI